MYLNKTLVIITDQSVWHFPLMKVEMNADQTRMISKRELIFQFHPSPLPTAEGDRRPVFSNFRMTGTPEDCTGVCRLYTCACLWDILTGNSENIGLNLGGDLDATSPLSVVCATQTRHVGHTSLMDVHHTV